MSESNQSPAKKQKKKGPIRFEAIIPVVIISTLTFIYFSYYFDHHMKKLVEYVGTQANGAEVNVDSIRTSFLAGSFAMNRLQVTDPEKPSLNSIEIGSVRFQYLWDALLRFKFVVEEASINNIQLLKPRAKPGYVVPPQPAKPSRIEEIQNEVLAQVKNKYSANMLGDMISLLEGNDYQDQLQKVRESLKSEARVKAMVEDVNAQKDHWDSKLKELSDTSKLKALEASINEVKNEKNVLQQAQGIKKVNDLLKDVQKQYKEIEKSGKELDTQVKNIAQYPKELQALVNEDIAGLKSRFSLPQFDFKDMAMHLFAGEFAEYIAKGRKYQALAEQYIPEKKEKEDVVVPRKRAEGVNYEFPITTGYPLFWLKKAAISSEGTADSYTGRVAGVLSDVTTSPKLIKKPIVLDLSGDFPASKIMGVKAVLTADFTRAISQQSALLQVNSFPVPEKLFVNDQNLKFGFLNAVGTSTLNASFQESGLKVNWNSTLANPKFLVETSNKVAREILGNVVNSIPVVSINGNASGTFSNLNMDISSNLGTELSQGFSREIGAKLTEAQNKINSLVEERINKPKEQLLAAIGGNQANLAKLGNLEDLFKKNEERFKAEIEKLKSGGGGDNMKDKGKKLLKGFKL